MLGLLKKRVDSVGSVLFRGNLLPRPEEFESLSRHGIELSAADAKGARWALRLSHPDQGDAELAAFETNGPPPGGLIDMDATLTDAERAEAKSAGTALGIRVRGRREDVLEDRKRLLWFLRQVMGEDGVAAVDHLSMRVWSREALDEELAHDARLDIESVYTIHWVYQGERESPDWVWGHTHGLAQLGGFDFDVINPGEGMSGDPMRAIAWRIVDGSAQIGRELFFAQPGGVVRLVESGAFMRRASPEHAAMRQNDADHNRDRAVLCEPVGRLDRLRRARLRPSRFCSSDTLDQCVFLFSDEVTEIMAERARDTLGLLRAMSGEFAEFEVAPLIKLGMETDNGGREHIWFEVHELADDHADATCLNSPHAVSGLRQGQRARHALDNLTDWAIMTPLGQINPRHMGIARRMREMAPELREMMERSGAQDE